jgi:hypothetical protein
VNNARNLNSRIARLEQTLGTLPCSCPDSTELSWPGHEPNPTAQHAAANDSSTHSPTTPAPPNHSSDKHYQSSKKAFGNDKRAVKGVKTMFTQAAAL